MANAGDLEDLLQRVDWAAYRDQLYAALEPSYRRIATEAGAHAVDHLRSERTRKATATAPADDFDWNPDDPFVDRFFTDYLADRVTQLDATTRAVLRELLQSALEDGEGESVTALASRIRAAVDDSHVFSPARALTIARTETANAYNVGAVLAYQQNRITHVTVRDGDGDPECAAADGSEWTCEQALAEPTSHPNCTRSFSPVLDEATEE